MNKIMYILKMYRSGYRWHTCVDAGEVSFFNHHVASICDSFVHPKHLRGTPWTSDRLCLSLFTTWMAIARRITSSLHSSATIASVKSNSVIFQVCNWNVSRTQQQ